MAYGLQPDDDPIYQTSEEARAGLPVYGGAPAPPQPRMAIPNLPAPVAPAAPAPPPPAVGAPAPTPPGYTDLTLAPEGDKGRSAFAGRATPPGYTDLTLAPEEPTDRSNFGRGVETSWEQLKQTGAGAAALVGDTFGLDGLKNWGLEKYAAEDEKVKALGRDNDDVFHALSKDGSFTDWLGYASGYTVGQAAQMVATGGIGGLIGKAVLKKGVQAFVGGMVERKTAELAAEELIAKGASEEAAKAQVAQMIASNTVPDALKNKGVAYAAQVLGATMAATALNVQQEVGSVYGDAVEQAQQSGVPVNLAKVWIGGGGAAALDTFTDMGALGRVLHGAGHGSNVVARVAKAGTAQALKEAGTEGIQTMAERWGAQKTLNDMDALHDVINSAAMGAVGGVGAGIPAGLHGRNAAQQKLRREGAPGAAATDVSGADLPAEDLPAITPGERRGLTPPGDERVAQAVSADQLAEGINDAAKVGDLPSVRDGLNELVGHAQKALDSLSARPAIYGSIGQAQAALDALADKHGAPAARGLQPDVAPVMPPPMPAAGAGEPPVAGVAPTAPAVPAAAPVAATPAAAEAQGTTLAEPQGDLQAQLAALADPSNPKDGVFIAKGTPVPALPAGVARITKPEGVYVTNNFQKAQAIRGPQPLTDQQRAAFLGLPEGKAATLARSAATGVAPLAVSAEDAQGNVAAQAATVPGGPNAAAVAAQTPPGGTVTAEPIPTSLGKRVSRVQAEQKQAAFVAPVAEAVGAHEALSQQIDAVRAQMAEAKGAKLAALTAQHDALMHEWTTGEPATEPATATATEPVATATTEPKPATKEAAKPDLPAEEQRLWAQWQALQSGGAERLAAVKAMTPADAKIHLDRVHAGGGDTHLALLLEQRAAAKPEPAAATKAKETSKRLAAQKEAKGAVQKPGAAGVLQHPPEGTGKAGRQRGRVEQGEQGKAPAAEEQAGAAKAGPGPVGEATLSINGTDHAGEPATLRVWVGEGAQGAQIKRAEVHYTDHVMAVSVRKKDTLHTILGRVEDDFSPPGVTREETTTEEPAPSDEREAAPLEGRAKSTAEKDAAIKRLRAAMRKAANRAAKRAIAPNATRSERQDYANEKLAPDFGTEKSVTLVDTPDKFREMGEVLRQLLHQNVQFFSPASADVNRAHPDGFKLPGDPDTVYVNVNNSKPEVFVFGHEIGHNIREINPKLWSQFMAKLEPLLYAPEFDKYFHSLKIALEREAKQRGESRPSLATIGAVAKDEVSSDAIGTAFMDPKFWELLSRSVRKEDRPLVARVMDEVVAALQRIARAMAEFFNPNVLKSGRPEAPAKMYTDIRRVHHLVRDLLVEFRGEEGIEPLTAAELESHAKEFYTAQMEPDEAEGYYPWERLTDDQREYYKEMFDLYHYRSIDEAEMYKEGLAVNKQRREQALRDTTSGAQKQTRDRAHAEVVWDRMARRNDPDFDELTAEQKDYFIRSLYDGARGVEGAPTDEEARAQIMQWREQAEESKTTEEKRVAAVERVRAKEAKVKEQAQEKVAAQKQAERERKAAIAASVEPQRKAIAERIADLTPREEKIVADHFNAAQMSDKIQHRLKLLVDDVLVDPRNEMKDLGKPLQRVLKRIIGDEVQYSREEVQYSRRAPEAGQQEAALQAASRYFPTDDPSAVDLIYGKEKMRNFAVGTRTNQNGFAKALQARTRQILGRKLDLAQPEDRTAAAKIMAREIKAALKHRAVAAKWYRENLAGALRNVAAVYPEVQTDPVERSMFTLALAITSNGNDIDNNVKMALQSYAHYRKTGEFQPMGNGKEAKAMEQAFLAANEMLARVGPQTFSKFLNSKFSVAALSRMDMDVGGEAKDREVYGSAMFGPKVGAAFYQNLNDNFDPLTMDRWFMRTIGRITGDLVEENPAKEAKQAQRFRDALERAKPSELRRFGVDPSEVARLDTFDDNDLFHLAGIVHRSWTKEKYQNGTELAAAARTWGDSAKALLDAPKSASHRNDIRDTVQQALSIVNRGRGEKLAAGDVQALLWYPEKDLYVAHKATSTAGNPTDYEQATARHLASVAGGGTRGGSASAAFVQPQTAGQGGVRQAALDERERRRIVRATIARQFALANPKGDARVAAYQSPRAYRPRDRSGLAPDVRPSEALRPHVLQTYTPDRLYSNAMAVAGVSTPALHELNATPEAASLFRDRLVAAQRSQGPAGAQVTVYPATSTSDESGYDSFRLFLSSDGRAGFALKPDGEIASVFKTLPDQGRPDNLKSVAVSMLHAATQMGGRWLNAFDTYLPDEYAIAGFHAVAHVEFNPEFAPAGWDYRAHSAWNEGKPNIVFMAYSDAAPEMYDPSYSKAFTDYGKAEAYTRRSVNISREPVREMRGAVVYSRKDMLNPVEIYALKGDKVIGMASYNVPNQTWKVYKGINGSDIRDDYSEHVAANTKDAHDQLRGPGVRLVRRKESPVMQGHRDDWGRGPDALFDIDTTPQPADNAFTKTTDKILSKTGLNKGPESRRTLVRQFQDKYIDVRELQKDLIRKGGTISADNNVYQKTTLFAGKTGNDLDTFKRRFVEPLEAQLTDAIKKGATVNDVEQFLIARHAPERNAVVAQRDPSVTAGSGMSNAEAAQTLRNYSNVPYAAELQSIGKIADDISTFKIDTMEQSGLIDADAAAGLRQYEHYVPLKGLDEDDTGAITNGIGVGHGFSGKGSLLKYATGRDSTAKHVISHMLLDAEAKIVRANKNEVTLALAKLAEDHPDPKFWTVNEMKSTKVWDPKSGTIRYQADNSGQSDNVLFAYQNGTRFRIELKDPSFAEAFTNGSQGGNDKVMEKVFNGLRNWNKYLAMSMTALNPEWGIMNSFRDAQTAYFNMASDSRLPIGVSKKVMKDLLSLKGHKDIYAALTDPDNPNGFGRWYKELEAQGGITKFFSLESLEDRAQSLKNLENRVAGVGLGAKLHNVYAGSIAQKAVQFLEDANATIEAAPRVLVYKALVEAGWSKPDAADYAKNMTVNFNRRGASTVLSSTFLFFNPAIQGTARLYEALKTPQGQMIAGSLFALGFVAGMTGNGSGGDDDKNGIPDYQQLSDWERATNIIPFAHGPKIPLPYGWNAFYAAGNFVSDAFFGRSPMGAAWASMKAAASAFSPVTGMVPTAISPAIDLMRNQNQFGGKIYKEQDSHFGPKQPASQMGSLGSTQTSKTIASTLNTLTGGSASKAGLADVNPDIIDYLAGSAFPGVVTSAARSASTVAKIAAGEPTETRDYPVYRRLATEPSKGKVYAALQDAKSEINELQNVAKNGTPEERAALSKEKPGWAGVAQSMTYYGKQTGDLYRRKAGIIDGKIKVADESKAKADIDAKVLDLENRQLKAYNTARARW